MRYRLVFNISNIHTVGDFHQYTEFSCDRCNYKPFNCCYEQIFHRIMPPTYVLIYDSRCIYIHIIQCYIDCYLLMASCWLTANSYFILKYVHFVGNNNTSCSNINQFVHVLIYRWRFSYDFYMQLMNVYTISSQYSIP